MLREGDTLNSYGEGNFSFGYFGGMTLAHARRAGVDKATSLLYIGNGQYYDPRTGRFLNRSAKPQQTNPYVPWSGDPAGMFVAPLSLLGLLLGKKKKRGKLEVFVVVLVLAVTLGMSLTGCSSENPPPTETEEPGQPINNGGEEGGGTDGGTIPSPTEEPTQTPALCITLTPTPTPTSRPTPTPSSPPNIYDYDPTKEPFSIRWNPRSSTPLSPSIPKNEKEAQYNPFYNGDTEYGGYNLCGQVSLSMIAEKYGYQGSNSESMLYRLWDNTGKPTGPTSGQTLLEAAIMVFPDSWSGKSYTFSEIYSLDSGEKAGAYSTGYWYGNDTGSDAANGIKSRMYSQNNIVLLTQLENTGDYRKLVTENAISHWVVITGMSEQWDSTNENSAWNWVRINNPFNNRVEYYPWADFKQSMNISGFMMVEIWKN